MAYAMAVLMLVLLAWTQLTDAAAAAVAAVQPTCDTGSSRILMANLDHLPAQCKPGHQPVAAAVLECFVSSRVVVHECRVVLLPGRPSSKAGLDCRAMLARGVLSGPANATLTGVLDSSKATSMLQAPASQQLLQGLDPAKLQQQLVQGMQLLFGQVTVTASSNTTSGKGAAAHTAAGTLQPGADGQKSTGAATSAGLRNNTSASQQQSRRHHPRFRPNHHKDQPSSNSTTAVHNATAGHSSKSSSSGGGAEADRSGTSTPAAAQAPGAAGTSLIGPGVTKAAGNTPAAAGGGSNTSTTSAAAANTTGQHAHAPSTAASPSTGRKLLQDLRSLTDAAAVAPAAARADAGAPDDSYGDDTADSAGEAELQEEAAAAAATTAPSTPAGAVLYRQGSSIILQPSNSCGYQFLVTRNPRLLQPEPSTAAGAGVSAMQPRSRHSRDRSWWVSAGALFAGVSAVLALVICYMSTQLWHRYRSYEALPSEPAPTDEQQHPQQQGSQHSSRVEPPLSTAYLGQARRPEMSLELQQTHSKSQPGSDFDNVSLQDQQHPA